jgi:serine/threonine-protein kinase HipA
MCVEVRIEIFRDGYWDFAASFSLLGIEEIAKGAPAGRGFLCYDPTYALTHQGNRAAALSCRHPVSLDIQLARGWPAFMVDLLPGGAGRTHYRTCAGLPDGPAGDWPLLQIGAANPPGNLRIVGPRDAWQAHHSGFVVQDVIREQAAFIKYASEAGASVKGICDVQGDSPKLLLTQDSHGRWHADGALPDARARRHWITKFPRSRAPSDQAALRYEALYHQVAMEAGLRVGIAPQYRDRTLFVPRFDRRVTAHGVERIAMESLYSLCGENRFGVALPQETLCDALHSFTTTPHQEIVEFVLRDVLNVALGNTDNHGRNQAVLRHADARVELAPLYDFAPMLLDREGIARVCRWQAEDAGRPRWAEVAESLGKLVDAEALRRRLNRFAPTVGRLVPRLHELGAGADLIPHIERRAGEVARSLEQIKP